MSENKAAIFNWNKNQLYKLLYGLYHTKVPTMIWGNPGGGKTSTVNFLGSTMKVPTEIRSGNKSDPTDFTGIPYLIGDEKDGKIIKFSEPKYVQIMKNNPDGILFFDEITTCAPIIQVALLSIIQDCRFGEFEIPQTIFRVAAGNYNNITGTHNMSLALMNRFCHIFYDMNIDFFSEGFISGWQNFEQCTINSGQEQVDKILKYRIAVVDFVKANPDFMNAFPKDGIASDPHEFAYPTPRSWEMVVKILSALDKNESDYYEELIKGCVGDSVGALFVKHISEKKDNLFVDLNNYVGKEGTFFLPDPERHDQVSHIMSSIVYYLEHDPNKYFELWIRIINLLHNNEEKYGAYGSYDSLIMKYMKNNLNFLLGQKIIKPGDLATLKNRIPCYELLGLTG